MTGRDDCLEKVTDGGGTHTDTTDGGRPEAAARSREPLPRHPLDAWGWLLRRAMGRYYAEQVDGPLALSVLLVAAGLVESLPLLSAGCLLAAATVAPVIYRERRWRAGAVAWGGQADPDDQGQGSSK